MRRRFLLAIIGMMFPIYIMAQDGSNIIYYEPHNLDSSLTGQYCHIDFGRISIGGQVVDTIEINVNGQKIKFFEHREDNGFNNWFRQQYLVGVNDQNQASIRLENSEIDSLTTDRIYVTSTLSYYANESPIDSITVFQHWYERRNISKVLIKK